MKTATFKDLSVVCKTRLINFMRSKGCTANEINKETGFSKPLIYVYFRAKAKPAKRGRPRKSV